MKLIYGTDFHGRMDFFEKLLDQAIERNIDHIIIGADILPKGTASEEEFHRKQKLFLHNLIDYFEFYKAKNPGKEIYTMLGNDDFSILNKNMIKADERKIIKLLSPEKAYKINGLSIVGYNFVPETPFAIKDWEKYDIESSPRQDRFYHYEYESNLYETTIADEKTTIEEDLEHLVNLSNPNKTIYVFHAPPKSKYLDVIMMEEHVGSEAMTHFIQKHNPLLTLHGHIHESYEKTGEYKEIIGTTLCVQPGSNDYRKNGKLNFVLIDIRKNDITTELYQK